MIDVVLRALVVLAILGAPASADPKRAGVLFAEAEALYKAGDFLTAATRFQAAYAADPDPVYLFNIAQAFRFGNRCADALASYKQFLAVVPDPPNLAKIKVWMRDSQACAKVRTDERARIERVEQGRAENDRRAKEQLERDGSTQRIEIVETPSDGKTGRRVAYVLGGLGVAMVGIAGYASVDRHGALGDRRTLLAGCNLDTPCSAAAVTTLDDRAKRDARIAIAGYLAGGVSIAAAVGLYVANRRSSPITITPVPSGAMAIGAFRF